jgi:alanyl-tRNA synthetase
MNSIEIRKKYLDYFKSKDHAIRPSSPLLPPPDDPTILFTTAGMVQFKPLWAGAQLEFKRAASVQKCLRAGGKGSDLENVGRTLRHHTFFEMLGNFSFGDYFKKEAILWAWEFVNDVVKLPKEKIWPSVYKDDNEAYDIWNKIVGIPANRIVCLGDKDNFWGPAGITGACGPSSEIYYDLGPERGCGSSACKPGCDCERYLEFWNLVFPQFYQNEDGTRRPLDRKGIDTGMGLERLCFLLQKEAKNNYETDLFKPIVDKIKEFTSVQYDGVNKQSFHVIADHVRALTFALSENILPSNEGRGYVLRRLLRRAVRHARKLNITEPFLYKLVDNVVNIMKTTYPELLESSVHTKRIILGEEERFSHTIDYGSYMLEEIISKLKDKKQDVVLGDDVFRLYDTYGFPVDLLQEVASEKGLKVDFAGFEKLMNEQKERARQSWTGGEKAEVNPVYKDILKKSDEQKFIGYDSLKVNTEVVAIVIDGKNVEAIKEGENGEIFLRETPFYAESGGQVGDTGLIISDKGEADITDTKKIIQGVISHKIKMKSGSFSVGDQVEAAVNDERRLSIARHHTATHILQHSLRQILGDHVKQSGSLVAPYKLRFDFTHFAPVEESDILRIEEFVNEKIMEDAAANCYELPLKDALSQGVLAFFGEKYGDKVRVLDIGGYSRELCGGTHLDRAGKIGLFRITSESSVAAGIRRIEAVCGWESIKIVNEERQKIKQINQYFKTEPENIITEIKKLAEAYKQLTRDKEKSDLEGLKTKIEGVISCIVNGVEVNTLNAGDVKIEYLRELGDSVIKGKTKNAVSVLGSSFEGKVNLIVVVTDDLVKKGYNAGKIVKELAGIVGGTGGGKPNKAQGGGNKPELLDKALKDVAEIVKELQV